MYVERLNPWFLVGILVFYVVSHVFLNYFIKSREGVVDVDMLGWLTAINRYYHVLFLVLVLLFFVMKY